MRKVYLEKIDYGDLTLMRFRATTSSMRGYRYELRNRAQDSVFLKNPILRRSLIAGAVIVDFECLRQDRRFSKYHSVGV